MKYIKVYKKINKKAKLFLIIYLLFNVSLLAYTTNSITMDKLPESAVTFIKNNFYNCIIENIYKLDNSFEVILKDDCCLLFDDKGEWLEVDGNDNAIPTDFIPKNVIFTVNKTNPNTSILKIVKKWDTYIISLDNRVNIFIDFSGMLVGQKILD